MDCVAFTYARAATLVAVASIALQSPVGAQGAPTLRRSAPSAAGTIAADSTARETLAPGVVHARYVRNAGPFIINVVRIDRRTASVAFEHGRAQEALAGREKTTSIAQRRTAKGATVLAAVNADFFNLKTGESENNVVVNGEWWKGQKVTDSPYDTFRNPHIQFGIDSRGAPLIDRFVFEGMALAGAHRVPILTLNANPSGNPEGTALYTWRFGTLTPRDTARATAELTLAEAGRRGDTLLYVRRGVPLGSSGNVIPPLGAVLAGYGPRSKEVAAFADADTVRVLVGVAPQQSRAPLDLVIGGWPRILRDGVDVSTRAAADEGTISRNAEVRHPRTAIGFSRDSSVVYLVTVDGRSATSVGMTLEELSALFRELGAAHAMNFDGGGSTTMVIRGKIVNAPTDPTGEREVGSALLLLAKPKP
jgi:hypothetical protein